MLDKIQMYEDLEDYLVMSQNELDEMGDFDKCRPLLLLINLMIVGILGYLDQIAQINSSGEES